MTSSIEDPDAGAAGTTTPHGVPTLDELVEAVEECLRDELLPGADGRQRYLLRVCIAALGQTRRELQLGAQHAGAHAERLSVLGVGDDAALADEIRAGVTATRCAEIVDVLRAQVADRLAVVAPRHPGAARQ